MKVAVYILLALLLMSFDTTTRIDAPQGNYSFLKGEQLSFRLHYGFITAGEAIFRVDEKLHLVNQKPCYNIEVEGKTTGAFDYVLRIRDKWGTYMDTSVYLPLQSYRSIEEGNYRKKEQTYFDYQNRTAKIVDITNKKETKLSIPQQLQDIVSGYYYIRLHDFSQIKNGEIIKVNGILGADLYELVIRVVAREKIKTKFGKINAIRLEPVMPKNDLFDGETSVKIWISDDKNKIPLRAEAAMFVGAVAVDLKNYKGLRHPIQFGK